VPALGKVMARRFVMAKFAPETLLEGGILAVLGATVEGLTTESSLLRVVFEMSVVAALPAALFLVEAPSMDLSLSTSVAVGSLAMSSLFKVLQTNNNQLIHLKRWPFRWLWRCAGTILRALPN
jgi:hypothetical protein